MEENYAYNSMQCLCSTNNWIMAWHFHFRPPHLELCQWKVSSARTYLRYHKQQDDGEHKGEPQGAWKLHFGSCGRTSSISELRGFEMVFGWKPGLVWLLGCSRTACYKEQSQPLKWLAPPFSGSTLGSNKIETFHPVCGAVLSAMVINSLCPMALEY